MINNAMNLSPYRRRATDTAHTASALGGMPNVDRRMARAQAAVEQVPGHLKSVQLGCTIFGGVFIALGLVMAIVYGVGTGSGMVISGAAILGVAWRVVPNFFKTAGVDLGELTRTVNALSDQAQLAHTGTPTTARVIAMQPTGAFVNRNPQVQTALEVQGPSGPYMVNTTAVISQMYIPQFQVGTTVNVHVNQQNPYDVAVVF